MWRAAPMLQVLTCVSQDFANQSRMLSCGLHSIWHRGILPLPWNDGTKRKSTHRLAWSIYFTVNVTLKTTSVGLKFCVATTKLGNKILKKPVPLKKMLDTVWQCIVQQTWSFACIKCFIEKSIICVRSLMNRMQSYNKYKPISVFTLSQTFDTRQEQHNVLLLSFPSDAVSTLSITPLPSW